MNEGTRCQGWPTHPYADGSTNCGYYYTSKGGRRLCGMCCDAWLKDEPGPLHREPAPAQPTAARSRGDLASPPYRIERSPEGYSEYYNLDTMRWSSQIFGYRVNDATLMMEDYVLCNVWGRTRAECAASAQTILKALNALEVTR